MKDPVKRSKDKPNSQSLKHEDVPKKKERLLRQKEKSKSTKHSDESSVVKKPDKKDHKKANEKAKILKTIDKLPVKTRKDKSDSQKPIKKHREKKQSSKRGDSAKKGRKSHDHPTLDPNAKRRLPHLKVSSNEVLRIGSALERFGVDTERRKAFEWLALNRADLQQDAYSTAHKLLIVVGDLPIDKELAIKTVHMLVDRGTITEDEYTKNFSVIERSPSEIHISVAQLAHLVNQGAAHYRQRKN